jgi:hypothetical protein
LCRVRRQSPQTAEAIAKKQTVVMATQKVQKDLDGFLGALALNKSKQDEVNKLKVELEKIRNHG